MDSLSVHFIELMLILIGFLLVLDKFLSIDIN
jgi:hypothetical protein